MMPLPEGWDDPPTAAEVASQSVGGNDTLGIVCVACRTIGLWRVRWVRHGINCKKRVLTCICCGHKQATKEVPI